MEKPPAEATDVVPVFGTWPRIYLAVALVNVAWIAFCWTFTRFGY